MGRLGWRENARCMSVDAKLLFPGGAGRPPKLKLEAFVKKCDECPVRQECLEAALESPFRPHGIWAGFTERELEPMWTARHPRPKAEIAQLIGTAVL
jgi:hypothetical protein